MPTESGCREVLFCRRAVKVLLKAVAGISLKFWTVNRLSQRRGVRLGRAEKAVNDGLS
jgi:hypothetical protein